MLQQENERLLQLFQEVLTLARRFGKVDWDEAGGRWVYIYHLPLPPQYDKDYTACLIELPPNYPAYPPKKGSYVDPDLGIASSHYRESDGRTFNGKNLHWLCAHLIGWNPKQPWTKGHNLLTVVEAVMYELNALKE